MLKMLAFYLDVTMPAFVVPVKLASYCYLFTHKADSNICILNLCFCIQYSIFTLF